MQLPTGSAKMTCGRTASRLRAAVTKSAKRQQKQAPAISPASKPAADVMRVSTRAPPWSFVMMAARMPRCCRRRAADKSNVVLPAPRKPPVRTKKGRLGNQHQLLAGADGDLFAKSECGRDERDGPAVESGGCLRDGSGGQ